MEHESNEPNQLILAALAAFGHNKKRMAEVTGVSYTQVCYLAAGRSKLGVDCAQKIMGAREKIPPLHTGLSKPVPFPATTLEDWIRGYLV